MWYNIVYSISKTKEAVLLTEAETDAVKGTTCGRVILQSSRTPSSNSNSVLIGSSVMQNKTTNSGLKIAIDDWSFYTIDNMGGTVVGRPSLTGLANGDKLSFDLYISMPKTVNVFVAFYGEKNELDDLESTTVTTTAEESTNRVEINFERTHTQAKEIKLFVWDEILRPQTKGYSVLK